MIREGREYRNFDVSNFGAVDREAHPYTVRGYYTTFEQPYQMGRDWDGNPYYEVMDRCALDGADTSDVIFQFNHDGMVFARQRNGSLTLGVDEHGGWCEAYLGGCQQGRDLFESIVNGLVDQMSFGFTIAPNGYVWDEATRTARVTRVEKVYDVSPVSIPANPNTEISARSYLDGVIEKELQELQERSEDRRRRLAMSIELETL